MFSTPIFIYVCSDYDIRIIMKMNVILIVMTASLMNVQKVRKDISDFPEESQNTHENIHSVFDI